MRGAVLARAPPSPRDSQPGLSRLARVGGRQRPMVGTRVSTREMGAATRTRPRPPEVCQALPEVCVAPAGSVPGTRWKHHGARVGGKQTAA